MSTIFEIFGVYFLFLVLFGTLSNMFGLCICLRKRLRHRVAFVFLSFMFVADTLSLYIWCLNHFFEVFYDFTIEELSIWWCRGGFLLQQFSMQWSSWLLVATTFDRFMVARIKAWRVVYFKSNQAFYASMIIAALVLIINLPLLMINGREVTKLDEYTNEETVLVECYEYGDDVNHINEWKVAGAILYSILPSILILSINSVFLYKIFSKKSAAMISPVVDSDPKVSTERKIFCISIVIITISFMLCTMPLAITSIVYPRLSNSEHHGILFIYSCDAIAFTYHSIKMEVLILNSGRFRREVGRLCDALFKLDNSNQIGNDPRTTSDSGAEFSI